MHLRKGVFITLEGGEGAGKTTLIDQVSRHLASEGYTVVKTREPGGTHLGEHIRKLLLEPCAPHPMSPYAELCLFLAARAQQIEEVIRPSLEARKVIICDRFNDSTIAYQGVARGLGIETVSQYCDLVCQGIKPHLTLYLDIDPATGLMRARREQCAIPGVIRTHDRIEAEGVDFHAKIRDAFRAIHKKDPHRFHMLDASQPPELVYAEAMKLIQPLLRS